MLQSPSEAPKFLPTRITDLPAMLAIMVPFTRGLVSYTSQSSREKGKWKRVRRRKKENSKGSKRRFKVL
jgi:hypothetical protein